MEQIEFSFIIICGPPASGKMTVGQSLSKITGYKLFFNHMSLELVNKFFDFGTPSFNALDKQIRFDIFREIANSKLEGLIFTLAWDFSDAEDEDYVNEIIDIFKNRNPKVLIVELECNKEERLKRNVTENRLNHKASKRDIGFSNQLLINEDKLYRTNSLPGEFPDKEILKINNTNKSAEEVADIIFSKLNH